MSEQNEAAAAAGVEVAGQKKEPSSEIPKFFDFTDVMERISEGKDLPAESAKRVMAALMSTRYVPLLANLVEHYSARATYDNPGAKLHEVKSRLVRTKRLSAAIEVAAEVEGFEGDVSSWKFHAHQKRRRRQLLVEALLEAGLPPTSYSRLLKRYVAGVISLPLREVIRRFKKSREKAEAAASETASDSEGEAGQE